MPKNNDLGPVDLPMKIRFYEAPTTEFKNNLDAIEVELLHCPTKEQLREYIVPFLEATWAEKPMDSANYRKIQKDAIIRECLEGNALPTALETVNLVFKISGISLQEVTHILRYRTASFSADCSGDKWWTHKAALVPNSIQNSNGAKEGEPPYGKDLYGRYQQIVKLAKQLYCDMIDSKQISIMDARYILPRCLETFYFMRISLKDAIHFIKQRIDRQIQPETDNIIAYGMYLELLEKLPLMNGIIDIDAPSQFYAKMARTGKATNLYFPEEINDTFEWNEKDFIYQCTRDQMNGTDEDARNKFNQIKAIVHEQIERLQKLNYEKICEDYKK
jgi:thymidylate synthase (FAD)